MFKINLKKRVEVFEQKNANFYSTKLVTGRIHKKCDTCGRDITPGEKSNTNTRKYSQSDKKSTKYYTYHTCEGQCTISFLNKLLKL